jgi:FKBP-type peptidyl-prolyl cis-trans isomerase 2
MIRIKRFRVLILPVIIVLTASGCLKNEFAAKEQNEKDLIATYLKDHGITDQQKTESGIYYIEEVAGTGLTPKNNDYVIINYTGRYISDNSIHETSYDSLKSEWTNASDYPYFVFGPLKFQFGFSIVGINDGLAMMKEGGKASLLIPSDKAFYDFQPMVYDIQLLRVIRDPIVYEDSVLREYLHVQGLDTLKTNYDSVYYKETFTPNAADSNFFGKSDTLYFRYTGHLVDSYGPTLKDDRIFDSNTQDTKPVKYVYGQSTYTQGFMLGFPDGLKNSLIKLRNGTHGRFILPYSTAFSDKGLIDSRFGYTIVPKYQTIVYDVVVEDLRLPPAK